MSTVCLPRVSHLSTRLTPRPSTLFFFPLFLLLLLLFFAFCFVSVCNFPFFFSFLANFSLYFLLSTLPSFFVAYKSYLLARSRGSLSSFSLVLVGLIRRGSTLNSGFLQIRGCGAIRCSRGIYYWWRTKRRRRRSYSSSRDDLEYSKKVRETCVTLVEIHFFVIHNFLTSLYPKISPISFKDI